MTAPEPPRRLPPTPAQRVEMAIERSAGGVAGSGTRYSSPVGRGGARSYAHGIPAGGSAGNGLVKLSDDDYDVDWGSSGGGGPICSALYRDPGSPSFGTAYIPSDLVDSFGDVSCFNYNGSADIEFLVDGWYQFNVYATVQGAGAGDVLHIEGDAGWDGTSVGYGVATSTSDYVFLTASSIPFYSAADDGNSIDARVDNHSSTSGTILHASIYVVRLS